VTDSFEQSWRLSEQVTCARCRRAARDDADFVGWEQLEDGQVCPGCLTMVEAHERRAVE
jgi:hypothetical protein